MSQVSSRSGQEIAKQVTRFTVTIVGLLLLRGLLSILPTLKNAAAIGDTFLTPLVVANAVVDILILVALLGFGFGMSRNLRGLYPQVPDLGTASFLIASLVAIVLAYNLLEVPIACTFISPQDVFTVKQNVIPSEWLDMWRQFIQGPSADVIRSATPDTLQIYQKLAVATLRQPPDLYGWVFLILSAIPVVGLFIIGARNLDHVSDLIFRKTSAVATGSRDNLTPAITSETHCNNCGQSLASEAKFCPQCGAACLATVPLAGARRCTACGTENARSAKFCKECGRAA